MPHLFIGESITGITFILYRLFISYKLFTLNSIKFMIDQDMSRAVLLLETLGENMVSCLSWFVGSLEVLGLWPLSSKLAVASLWPQVLPLLNLSDSDTPFLFTYKDSCDNIEPTWITQYTLSYLQLIKSLNSMCSLNFLLPCVTTYSQASEIRVWTSLDIFFVYYSRELLGSIEAKESRNS